MVVQKPNCHRLRFAILVAGFASRSSSHQADWQTLEVSSKYLQKCINIYRWDSSSQVWISDITSEADFTLGCRRENKSSHAAYDWRNRQGGNLEFWIVLIKAIRPQTKPHDVEISLLPGDREGNEWGVVAFLLEVQKYHNPPVHLSVLEIQVECNKLFLSTALMWCLTMEGIMCLQLGSQKHRFLHSFNKCRWKCQTNCCSTYAKGRVINI